MNQTETIHYLAIIKDKEVNGETHLTPCMD